MRKNFGNHWFRLKFATLTRVGDSTCFSESYETSSTCMCFLKLLCSFTEKKIKLNFAYKFHIKFFDMLHCNKCFQFTEIRASDNLMRTRMMSYYNEALRIMFQQLIVLVHHRDYITALIDLKAIVNLIWNYFLFLVSNFIWTLYNKEETSCLVFNCVAIFLKVPRSAHVLYKNMETWRKFCVSIRKLYYA